MNDSLKPAPAALRTSRWLIAAGVYNLVWGAITIGFPHLLFDLCGIPRLNYPEIWQCVGMIVGVYGIGYLIAAGDSRRHWPIVLVGFLGKIFGPLGFAFALWKGTFPPIFGLTILTNDLLWWIPFGSLLLDAAVEEQRAKWTTAERSFSALQQEGTRQKTGWRGALGEAFFLNSHEELLRRLEAFYRHHASSSCGPGTEMGHRHGKLIRSTTDYCTMLEYRPSLRVWFVVHDALERVTARPVSPDVAFFNALCAIASAHASIDETEEGVIRAAVLDAELAIDEAQMRRR